MFVWQLTTHDLRFTAGKCSSIIVFLAEQKLRDKLAAAMREKMTQVTSNTREKSLQAERKRKAAMFVNMLKSKKPSTGDHDTPIGIQYVHLSS